MAGSCTFTPRVRSTRTGELVNSKLFSDLRRAVGYINARKVWIEVRSDSFEENYGDSLPKDENGEYTIKALKSVPELKRWLGIRVRKSHAAQEIGAYKPQVATAEAVADAESKSEEFNSRPDNEFIALPEQYSDDAGVQYVRIALKKNTPDTREEASKITRKNQLTSNLSSVFERLGLDSELITSFIERCVSWGISAYDAAVMIADDFRNLVRKANGRTAQIRNSREMGEVAYEMLFDNPLIARLLRSIESKNLLPEILDDIDLQKTSKDIALEEAAIRLISDYVIDGNDLNSAPDGIKSLKPLIDRIGNVVNDMLRQVDQNEIESIVNQAERSPWNNQNEDEWEASDDAYEEQSETKDFKNVSEKVKKQKELLHHLIENNVRRYKIVSSRDKDYDRDFERALTNDLAAHFQDAEYELGIYEFIDASLTQLQEIEERLKELRADTEMPSNKKAIILKNIKDFIKSYEVALKAIKNAEYSGVIKPNAQRTESLNKTGGMIGYLLAEYEAQKEPLVLNFIRKFVGSGLVVPFGKDKGKVYTAEEILKMAEKDISIFDRWLDSMAESGDKMLRMLDAESKEARNKARLRTIEYKKRLDGIFNRAKRSGIKDFSFMFERTPDGHKTGKYISKEAASHLDPARQKFWQDMIELKEELDNLLPKGATTTLNIIRVRKDYIERLKSQDSIDGVLKETKEALRDKVKRRSDNAETGGDTENNKKTKNVLIDFDEKQVDTLPIMYVNSKDGENIDDISEDVVSSMLMYANMATNYSEMSNIVGTLELVREAISERPVQQTAGSKVMVNVLKAFGVDVKTNLTKSGEATRLVQRMNDWFHSQVYSRYMADEGEIFGMDVGMLANVSNEVTALNQFALNILSGISNVMTASAMNRIESICGQYFTVKSLTRADAIFWKALPDFLKDVGNPVKTSKLALFMEKFNTMQDFESEMMGQEYGKSRLGRLISTNSLYVINNAGELWIQNRAALALGEEYGLLDENNNPIGLWDSQEVVVDKDGVARLVTKKGVHKADGTAFDEEKDTFKFTKKAKSINQRMNGIYNYEDRCAAQAYSWGRMALMFRKWIKPSLNRRYASLEYNYDTEEWEEGFYTTGWRFIEQLYKDLQRGELDIVTSYKNLDPREQANMVRLGVEVGQFISTVAAFTVLKNIKKQHDDDDDDRLAKSWWFNQLLYQTRRLQTEIGSQMIINPQMMQEAFNIIKSPAASVSTWEGVSNMTKLLMPQNWTTTLQTGRYKGHTKAYKLFWDSPLIPMHRTIYRGLHPQNSLQFYDL